MHGNEQVTPSPSAAWPSPAPPAPGPAGGRRVRRTPVVVGVVVISFFVVGLGVAFAQTDPSATTTTVAPSPAQVVPGPAPVPAERKHLGRGHGPFGGKLFGLGHFGGLGRFGGLHGEFTIKKPDGNGFQTWATQTGEVTAVSPSSITVKSEDNFSRTYSVDENTVVGSGRDGIGTVKTGDTVHVAGLVENGNARAATVVDSTSLRKIGEHWGVPKRK